MAVFGAIHFQFSTNFFVLARVICWRILTRKLQSKHGNFLFFRAVGKIILVDYQ